MSMTITLVHMIEILLLLLTHRTDHPIKIPLLNIHIEYAFR